MTDPGTGGRRTTGEALVAGVDSSTQSVKVVLCRADDGTVVERYSAPHPDGTECHPRHWEEALAGAAPLLQRASAVSVAAQQHGLVALDDQGEVVRSALLWNDTRSAPQAAQLIEELGGPDWWAEQTGSVPVASFTVTKLRWMAEHEPDHAERTASVLLPHDWLTWRLATAHESPGRAAGPSTDRGDASGTGYWSPATGEYLPQVLAAALGHVPVVPLVAVPTRPSARPGTGPWWRRAPATTWVLPSASGSGRARWWSRSAPRAPRSRWRTGRASTLRVRSRGSPTPPGGSCGWCAPSTRRGCSARPRPSSTYRSSGCRGWRSRLRPAPTASCCCRT